MLRSAYSAAVKAVGRAKELDLPVDVDWMLNAPTLIAEQDYRCALTGIAFNVDFRTAGAGGTHLAPSPDRIGPGLGYVQGNVRWVLWAVHRAKGEMPEELFLHICREVAANTPFGGELPRLIFPTGVER